MYFELQDSYMGISGEIDLWDGLDDVDMEQSITYNELDNEDMTHKCSETFANRYNASLVSLSMIQSLTIFPLRIQPPSNFTQHRIIAIGHVHGNHFVQVYPKRPCKVTNCYPTAQSWSTYYTSRMQVYTQIMSIRRYF